MRWVITSVGDGGAWRDFRVLGVKGVIMAGLGGGE